MKKVRVQFDIPEDSVTQLDELQAMIGVDTRKELFNNALTLLEWTAYEVASGKEILSRKGDEYNVLQMPALRHVARMHRRQEELA